MLCHVVIDAQDILSRQTDDEFRDLHQLVISQIDFCLGQALGDKAAFFRQIVPHPLWLWVWETFEERKHLGQRLFILSLSLDKVG